jgi:hypothetical protein
MTNITEEGINFKTFEKDLFDLMCYTARALTKEHLELLDKIIADTRDTKRFRLLDCNRETTIKTLFGEVTYVRRYYRDKQENIYVFLLDESMQIFNGFGLVSENLVRQIVNEVTEKSFRKTASGISSYTGQYISAQGAWNVVQQFGKAIEQQEARLTKLEGSGSVGHLGNIPSKVLFVEHDELWIPRQREKRRAKGTAVKDAKMIGKKLGKLPMCMGTAYTGFAVDKNGRCNTVNKTIYASFGGSKKFRMQFGTLLNNRYDMDGIEHRITNGDGEGWIRTEAEENDSTLQLDPFHRSQAITKAVRDKNDRSLLCDALDKNDVEGTLSIISELIMKAHAQQDEKAQKRLNELQKYFNNNKDILLSWQERGIQLPTPPTGISYRGMGTQESNNTLYAQRMKHRRGAWSENGADNMARILSYINTIGLDAILDTLPEAEPIAEVYAQPLSATQSPKHDGKGYGADWLFAPMPFENAFKTNGREAIRDIFRNKPLSGRIH